MKHRIQSVVVNGIHVQECRRCGWQWLASEQTPTKGPDASTCPGRQP